MAKIVCCYKYSKLRIPPEPAPLCYVLQWWFKQQQQRATQYIPTLIKLKHKPITCLMLLNLAVKAAWITVPYCVQLNSPLGSIWIALYFVYLVLFEFLAILCFRLMSILNYHLASQITKQALNKSIRVCIATVGGAFFRKQT